MPSSRLRPKLLGTQASELAFATPQIMAHRLMRMAFAGSIPSTHDQREFRLMSSEKVTAFYESWNAMYLEAFRINQELCLSMMRSSWAVYLGGGFTPIFGGEQFHRTADNILRHGLAPIHRSAMANMKRLKL